MPLCQRWKGLEKAISLGVCVKRSRGRHIKKKKNHPKQAETVGNLLISTNYFSRKCWELERICASK